MANLGELTPQQLERQEAEERLQQYMKDHPEHGVSQRGPSEGGPQVAEFEKLVASFESTYSLAELHAIVDLRMEDAPRHPLREPAKEALAPIVGLLNYLKEETSISPAKYRELKEKYVRLTRAVGIIKNNVVVHNKKFDLDS